MDDINFFFFISTAIRNVGVLIDEQIDRVTARKSIKIVINSCTWPKNIKGKIEENTNLHRPILFLKIDLIPISSEFKLKRNINQNLARLLQKFTKVSINTSPHSCADYSGIKTTGQEFTSVSEIP